ncbi:hypothetical protein Lesp02_21480 [Lentzea sp. NBRC 105346]|nr:hypothetical protein Lesp02_21480 [Lentzea sp. NBRC 105346]
MKAVVIGTVLCALAACSTQSGETRPEPALGPVPVIQVDADVRFPLDDYLLSPERRVTLRRGQDLLVQKCLRRLGFEMNLPDREPDEVKGRVIGVVDDAEAAKYGYSDPETLEAVRRAEQIRKEQKPWPAQMMVALNGGGPNAPKKGDIPQGGCTGEARRALGRASQQADQAGDENFVIGLSGRSTKLAEADSRLKAVWGKWSACMKESGYDYADPWGPNDDKRFAGDDASPEEIATARADVACRRKHDVNGIWVAVRTAYQNRLIGDNAEALDKHRRLVDEQVRKAAEVVSGK